MEFLKLRRKGAIAHIEFDNPDKLNALGSGFWEGMEPLIADVDADLDLRVVVLTGAGRAFTSGLDVVSMLPKLPIDSQGGAPDGARQAKLHRQIRSMQRAVTCLERCRIPVIAAIHGYCLGAGVEIATACDIRLASEDTKFGVRETKIAIVADTGTLQRLPRVVGPGIARELIFTGRDFDAAYAEKIGLVNRVLPDKAAVHEAAFEMAREIAANPPLTVQGAKLVLNEAVARDIDQSLEYVATYNAAHLVTQDLGVAVTAAMTKQTPEFSGR